MNTEALARFVTAEQLDSYIDDVNQFASSGKTGISACLLVVLVREDLFAGSDKNLNDAYLAKNVSWQFASKYLCALVLEKVKSNATAFIKNFITEVNKQGITKMKGVAGNFLELIIGKFLSVGKFDQCRKLRERRDGEAPFEAIAPLWGTPLTEHESDITAVPKALTQCMDMSLLYCFCKSFRAVDFAALGFRVLFQVTDSGSHLILLTAIKQICEHVRTTYGEEAKVLLLFVVPDEIVRTAPNWQYTQSFTHYKDVTTNKRKRGAAADADPVDVKEWQNCQSKFESLSMGDRNVLRNLEQWIVCYKEE